ncbi:hypothetical protein BJ508DRAFT_304236 [Ascobolus immersus RN42]|uniref:Uncharacterized protein n=1 Tax=Ascobolus immersus RN42 TaxID=1160509 RepID=A0A3N4ID68_ASCIM|nr:hypothetical protein BJ508DRAFT_304236 [Ascobolus immersus RN42]
MSETMNNLQTELGIVPGETIGLRLSSLGKAVLDTLHSNDLTEALFCCPHLRCPCFSPRSAAALEAIREAEEQHILLGYAAPMHRLRLASFSVFESETAQGPHWLVTDSKCAYAKEMIKALYLDSTQSSEKFAIGLVRYGQGDDGIRVYVVEKARLVSKSEFFRGLFQSSGEGSQTFSFSLRTGLGTDDRQLWTTPVDLFHIFLRTCYNKPHYVGHHRDNCTLNESSDDRSACELLMEVKLYLFGRKMLDGDLMERALIRARQIALISDWWYLGKHEISQEALKAFCDAIHLLYQNTEGGHTATDVRADFEALEQYCLEKQSERDAFELAKDYLADLLIIKERFFNPHCDKFSMCFVSIVDDFEAVVRQASQVCNQAAFSLCNRAPRGSFAQIPTRFSTMPNSPPSSISSTYDTTTSKPHQQSQDAALHDTSASLSLQPPHTRPRLDPAHLYPTPDAFRTTARAYAAFYNFQPRFSLRDSTTVQFRCYGPCDTNSTVATGYPPYLLERKECSFLVEAKSYKRKNDMVAVIAKGMVLRHSCGVKGEVETEEKAHGVVGASWRATNGVVSGGMPKFGLKPGVELVSRSEESQSIPERLLEELMLGLKSGAAGTEMGTVLQQTERDFEPLANTSIGRPHEPTPSQPARFLLLEPPASQPSNTAAKPNFSKPTIDKLLEPQLASTKSHITATLYHHSSTLLANRSNLPWDIIDLEIRQSNLLDATLQRCLTETWDLYLSERQSVLPGSPPFFAILQRGQAPVLVALTVEQQVEKVKAMREVLRNGWRELVRRAEEVKVDLLHGELGEREALWVRRIKESEEVGRMLGRLGRAVKGFGGMNTGMTMHD